jgi:predicted helicase
MHETANEEQLKTAVKKYFNKVREIYNSGSRNIETTYNNPIIELLKVFGCNPLDVSGGRAKKKGQNVDIELWRADDDINGIEPFAAIEVKKIGGAKDKVQLANEIKSYGNMIFTDNAVWEFYRAGNQEMYDGFRLITINEKKELKLDEDRIDLFIQSIKDFILAEPTNIKSSNKLAQYMARYAQSIRVTIYNILQTDSSKRMFDELTALHSKLQQELLPDLSKSDFADMYAQTIVYGLFIARYNDKALKEFSRGKAIENLSKESHLLKQFFQHIANSGTLHAKLNYAIDGLCKLFSIANLPELLSQYEDKDTIIHFYEDFLGYYDLAQRKKFGAYYTPVQVVRYMIDMVDKVLVNEFSINGGLSNNSTTEIKVKSNPYQDAKKKWHEEKTISVPQVAILDPACGTGTFGAEIIKFVKEKYFSVGNAAFYRKWIQDKNGLLSRLIGFEIMMTSYVVAHLKMRRTITETLGGQPDEIIPTNIFLTNTLAEPKSMVEKNAQITMFDFSGAITEEAENADKWKARRPIKVIIGNPPYLAASTNPYDISAYKFETDGRTKLNERNPKWLNDDYVKFIRFAEQHIEKTGTGVLAFISNNGYLDNPTFRGMRASLLRTFDKIYILNLHGNSIKKETCPDGSKDENVFDITVGVSIIIAIKTTKNKDWAKVFYGDLYGLREKKFKELDSKGIAFAEINIDSKTALFIPQNDNDIQEYNNGISLVDLFNRYSAGMVLGRDSLCVQNSRQGIERVLADFQTKTPDQLRVQYELGRDTDWTIKGAINDIENRDGKITQIAYRVFDNYWTYYSGRPNGFFCRPRSDVMNNFDGSKQNVGICFTRTDKSPRNYSMIFVTDKITESCILTTQTAGIATVVPLYIAPSALVKEWQPNLNVDHFNKLTQNLKTKPTPQEVFDYCYGVLYDPNYRAKYNEFLKRDYPRVPIIENEKIFAKYKAAGERLRQLHLMQTSTKIDLAINGANLKIEAIKYSDGKLQINKETFITGVPQAVWSYYIGGYQVLDKWFKSHKGEELTRESFEHIQKVAGILVETIHIQKKLAGGE